LQTPDGSYTRSLVACLIMEAAAAFIVLLPVMGRLKRAP
jgi:hypothetical protein